MTRGSMRPLAKLGRARGVSLIEALVALAVMAFGMLGIVAIQSSLRFNADVAKQRAEAVRMAQETMERFRSYTAMAPAVGKVAWEEVNASAASAVAGYTTNASYTRTVTVDDVPDQRFKTVTVTVGWSDRSGNPQAVSLKSVIHRSPPALAGALAISGEGTVSQSPGGRHPTIPKQAVDLGDGTSSFAPPGAGAITWRFSNATGLIVSRCDGPTCLAVTARLVSGFIRFATGTVAPTPADAEAPPDPALVVGVVVTQTFPSTVLPPECFVEALPAAPATPTAMRYLCAVRVSPPGLNWSGRVSLTGLTWATSASSISAAEYRVCRYTPHSSNAAVGTDMDPGPAFKALTNDDHPLDYALANSAYLNHNFLVIRAGNNTSPFECPGDDPATSFVNGNTFRHQPAT